MMGLYFLIGALVLIVSLLLFGFVGCSHVGSGACEAPSPYQDYPTAVLSEVSTGDLVAYWSLGEPSSTPVPSSGGAAESVAADENGDVHHGDYFKLDPAAPDDLRHSPPTAGQIDLGESGLLRFGGADRTCIDTDGGYVQVPWADYLNPPEFTFEAWVHPDNTLDSKYFYCLVESTGPQGLGPKKTGWGLYLGPSDINNPDPAGPLFWQVWMGDGNQLNRAAIAKPGFSQLGLTYLALTFNGTQRLELWVYFPDTYMDIDLLETRVLDKNPSIIGNFIRNEDSPDGQGDFFIGTGSNLTTNPASQRLYPFKGKIQEVALYKRDLSYQRNSSVICPLETLGSHYLSGGRL